MLSKQLHRLLTLHQWLESGQSFLPFLKFIHPDRKVAKLDYVSRQLAERMHDLSKRQGGKEASVLLKTVGSLLQYETAAFVI